MTDIEGFLSKKLLPGMAPLTPSPRDCSHHVPLSFCPLSQSSHPGSRKPGWHARQQAHSQPPNPTQEWTEEPLLVADSPTEDTLLREIHRCPISQRMSGLCTSQSSFLFWSPERIHLLKTDSCIIPLLFDKTHRRALLLLLEKAGHSQAPRALPSGDHHRANSASASFWSVTSLLATSWASR